MEIGHIYITGVIGNSYNEKNEITEKGVELIDIMEQFASFESDPQMIHVHINSPGGFVEVGEDIANFFAKQTNVVMIAEENCMSIATVIHTSVPLQNRKVVAGCKYMIHNPWIGNQSGDAEAFKQISEHLNQIETKLESHYAKATGQPKEVLSVYMKKDTYLSMDQLVKFGFAAEIIQAVQMRAVALLRTNSNSNKMVKTNLSFAQRVKMATAMLSAKSPEEAAEITKNAGREAKALIIDAGEGMTLETPFMDITVGDPVMANGVEVTDGSLDGEYTLAVGGIMDIDGNELPAGTVIVVAENKVASITAPASDASASAQGEETLEELKAQLEAANAKAAELEVKLSEANATAEEAVTALEGAAALKSGFVPPRAQASFRPPQGKAAQEKTKGLTREAMADRRAEYSKK